MGKYDAVLMLFTKIDRGHVRKMVSGILAQEQTHLALGIAMSTDMSGRRRNIWGLKLLQKQELWWKRGEEAMKAGYIESRQKGLDGTLLFVTKKGKARLKKLGWIYGDSLASRGYTGQTRWMSKEAWGHPDNVGMERCKCRKTWMKGDVQERLCGPDCLKNGIKKDIARCKRWAKGYQADAKKDDPRYTEYHMNKAAGAMAQAAELEKQLAALE